jgi:ethanolamine ammonia-lyase small subunit
MAEPPAADPWAPLRTATRARIGLGRAGDALPLAEVLGFQIAHARARDAVHGTFDPATVAAALGDLPHLTVHSAAADRATYLRRPDLGRRLDPASRAHLASLASPGYDAVFVVADGLSARAAEEHAAPLIRACLPALPGWRVAPVVMASQARVALGDEISELLGARICAVLIGERPGLSVAASLGVYLTWEPRVGRRDSERNCISNIHADGLPIAAAADLLAWLLTESRRRGLSGTGLKDDRDHTARVTGPA